jgi:hypothetical protein
MKMNKFNANVEYLENNNVTISKESVFENLPYSRELYFSTPSGGDFSICVEELTREEVLRCLSDYDINEETLLWWENNDNLPFDNIKALYEDIEEWVANFKAIAEQMPY